MKRASPSGSSASSRRRSPSESGEEKLLAGKLPGTGSLANEISERLKLLALPNSHLVEAVLKQHSHLFTENCRDRLRNLLQVIVNVNVNNKKKFDSLNEKLNIGSIKNMRQRMKDIKQSSIMTSARNEKQVNKDMSAHCHSTTHSQQTEKFPEDEEHQINYGPNTSSMMCNASSVVTQENYEEAESHINETHIMHHTDPSGQIRKQKEINIFSKDKLLKTYAKAAQVYRFDLFNDSAQTACGDCDSDQDSYFGGNSTRKKSSNRKPREFGDAPNEKIKEHEIVGKQQHQSRIDMYDDKKLSGKKSQIPRRVRNKSKNSLDRNPEEPRLRRSSGTRVEPPCGEHMVKPIEVYKERFVIAAYDCWMDYMIYVKNTLDYLHPYILNLLHTYYTRDKNDPERHEYETKLPKVLINSMKNIKTWRNALDETIECCKKLFPEDDGRKSNTRNLYERYYKKLDGLPLPIDFNKKDLQKSEYKFDKIELEYSTLNELK